MKFFDSHCHLQAPAFATDKDQVIEKAAQNNVSGLCIPAITQKDWEGLLHLKPVTSIRQFIAIGLHPCFWRDHDDNAIHALNEQLEQNRHQIAAIGETGLDFYDKNRTDDARDTQQYWFHQQVLLAKQYELPLIIHARKSHDAILKVLRNIKPDAGGVIHAFSGSEQQARQYIDLGFKLGFGGGITYPRARKTRHLAATLPLECIVLETDAPDMPLFGYQGQRNTPCLLYTSPSPRDS